MNEGMLLGDQYSRKRGYLLDPSAASGTTCCHGDFSTSSLSRRLPLSRDKRESSSSPRERERETATRRARAMKRGNEEAATSQQSNKRTQPATRRGSATSCELRRDERKDTVHTKQTKDPLTFGHELFQSRIRGTTSRVKYKTDQT